MSNYRPKVIAVSLNPCIDRGIEVPGFTLGAHQTGRELFRRPAGKAVNLARILGTVKVPTLLIGFIGKDLQDSFEDYLTTKYISCQLFPTSGTTRENITLFDPVSRVETHIRDRGFEVTGSDLGRLRKQLALLCRKDVYVVFSGSLPPGLSVEDFCELARVCRSNEAQVCVDSAGAVLRACLPLGIWMMKPNASELSEMLDRPLDNAERIVAAGKDLAKRIGVTLVSVGKEGAFLFSPSENLKGCVSVDPTRVKNTVGCGDALLAGFLSERVNGKSMTDSFIFALALASASAVSLFPADISLSDVNEFLPAVTVSPLALD